VLLNVLQQFLKADIVHLGTALHDVRLRHAQIVLGQRYRPVLGAEEKQPRLYRVRHKQIMSKYTALDEVSNMVNMGHTSHHRLQTVHGKHANIDHMRIHTPLARSSVATSM